MLKIILIGFCLVLCCGSLWAQQDTLRTLRIDKEVAHEIRIEGDYLHILCDSTGSFSVQDIVKSPTNQHFRKHNPTSDLTQHNVKTYWFECRIQNGTTQALPLFFKGLGDGFRDDVSLYVPQANGQFQKLRSGSFVPWSERQGEVLDGMMNVEIPAYQTMTFYYEVKMNYSYALDGVPVYLAVIQPDAYYRQKFKEYEGDRYSYVSRTFFMIYTGILLVMALYNLAIFFSVREVSYLFYVFFLGLQLFGAMAQNQLITYLFSEAPKLGWLILFYSGPLYDWCFVLFLAYYFNTPKNYPLIHKILFYTVIFRIGLYIYYDLFRIFFHYSLDLLRVQAFGALVLFGVSLACAVWLYRLRNPLARNFLLAMLPWIVVNMLVIVLVIINGSVAFNFGQYAFFALTSTFMVVMFSNVLSQRLNLMQQEVNLKAIEKEKLEKEKAIEIQQIAEQKTAEMEIKVNERTAELQRQKKEAEKTNENIRASIQYASRIQLSFLRMDLSTRLALPEHFVLFRPRDIVSGDFYYFRKKENTLIMIAADCTGHGVPGALMSLIGVNSLNRIILEKNILSPDVILSELHKAIRLALHQYDAESQDGMDISVCALTQNEKNNTYEKLEFAGAMNPLYLIQNQVFKEIKGSRKPVGGRQSEQERVFDKHTIALTADQPTMFYIFSDGYADQIGGTEGRKFLSKRFREMLLDLREKPLFEQKIILERRLEEWRGSHRQIDDILVIGVSI
jgi:two-component system, sensor histidine kinase LadS